MAHLAYALLIGGYLLAFRRDILRHDYPMLLAACALMGLSVGLDLLSEIPGHSVLEDGSKFLGIGSWLGFFVSAARRPCCWAP